MGLHACPSRKLVAGAIGKDVFFQPDGRQHGLVFASRNVAIGTAAIFNERFYVPAYLSESKTDC